MKNGQKLLALAAAITLVAATPAHKKKPVIPPATPAAVTHHVARVAGQSIPYTARAGTITLRNDKEQITARMFYVAYTKDGASVNKRPVTFFYNGGPGSSTVWLHMASFSPVRVRTTNGAPTGPAPFTLGNNDYSLLDKTDMVFIDAPNTGYS
ncbi:MAG: peptidase S10, partial [Candidatus Eremiobacteraeota bacterium]|nr:peptidase S10 [Candidatus Eremiobacteraeota bacterium]